MLGRGVGGPSNSTSYGNESFVRRRVIKTLPRDSSLMDIAELTKDREWSSTSVVLRMMPFFNLGRGRLNQWRPCKRAIGEKQLPPSKTASGRSGKV